MTATVRSIKRWLLDCEREGDYKNAVDIQARYPDLSVEAAER